jgi:drug/metabolite transporter (DMT)-like permease
MSQITVPQRPALISPLLRQRLLFAFLCIVWGTTWLAMKTGVTHVPPAFFSGTRWSAAGLILLAWRLRSGQPVRIPLRHVGRVVVVALLMISLNAAIQLYGLRQVGSGLGAVLTSGITPVALLLFGVWGGQERFSARQLVAIGLGVLGLVVLFGPATFYGEFGPHELLGSLAVVAGCLCYCAGTVFARPLMRSIPPAHVAMLTNLIGGGLLLVLSLPFEPGAWRAASFDWGLAAWVSWCFLLLLGSLGASIIYFALVRDWGASKTGTYSFVSPVLAVILGIVVYDERLQATDAIGMLLMLGGAAVALSRVK